MLNEAQPRTNPLPRLASEIQALEKREKKWASVVQVPRKRARELMGMTAQGWRDASQDQLSDEEIDDILNRTDAQGESGLNGLKVCGACIFVASRIKDDCENLLIIEGTPMD